MDRLRFEMAALHLGEHVWTAASLANQLPFLEVDGQALHSEIRTSAMSAGLGVVVAGGEGVGKSRLLNGLVGHTVTPEHGGQAGTVAPVTLEYERTEHPRYRIIFRDGRAATVDEETFRRYILQVHNPDNDAEVERGIVSLDAILLSDGLVLTDTPGAAGAAGAIRKDIEALFGGSEFAVLGVCADREYAPLIRLITQNGINPRRIVGIVNAVSDLFFQCDEQEAREKIARRVDAIRTVFAGEGIPIGADNVWVIHLPSLRRLLSAENPSVAKACHTEQVDRLHTALRTAADTADYKQALKQAKAHAERLLQPCTEEIAERSALWKGLRRGRGEDHQRLTARLDEAERETLTRWSRVMRHRETEQALETAWSRLKRAIEDYVRSVDRAHLQARDDLEAAWWFDDRRMDEVLRRFDLAVDARFQVFSTAADEIGRTLAQRLFWVAGELVGEFVRSVPLLAPLNRPLIHETELDERLLNDIVLRPLPAPPEVAAEPTLLARRGPRLAAVRGVFARVAHWDDSATGRPRRALDTLAERIFRQLQNPVEHGITAQRQRFRPPNDELEPAFGDFQRIEAGYNDALRTIRGL